MTNIRLIIVDDQRLMREGLRTILELEEDFEVAGIAANGREALDLCRETRPDIALMDIRMPGMDGVEATGWLKENMPEVKVIILTTFDDDELIVKGLKAGAKTYLLKDLPSERLAEIIRATHRGDVVLQPEIAAKLVEKASEGAREETGRGEAGRGEGGRLVEPLTKREKEILLLMSKGLPNLEIAEKLFISEGTVKNNISNIYGKLGTSDRTQAVLYALKEKLI
jgi:DNA-binding NarL/FixJ family response regulator